MHDTMTEFRWFSIFDWEEEQAYLQRRHAQGWRFVRVSFVGLYHFEACQPQEVVYQLDYNREGLAHKSEYLQMFSDCGWEYIQDFMGYSYFRKAAADLQQGETGIFCDEDSRMDMLQRVIKGRLTPLLVVFCCIILPQLNLQASMHHPFNRVLFWIYVGLLALYTALFASFAVKYRKLRRRKK